MHPFVAGFIGGFDGVGAPGTVGPGRFGLFTRYSNLLAWARLSHGEDLNHQFLLAGPSLVRWRRDQCNLDGGRTEKPPSSKAAAALRGAILGEAEHSNAPSPCF
jgi:hypothetical protein